MRGPAHCFRDSGACQHSVRSPAIHHFREWPIMGVGGEVCARPAVPCGHTHTSFLASPVARTEAQHLPPDIQGPGRDLTMPLAIRQSPFDQCGARMRARTGAPVPSGSPQLPHPLPRGASHQACPLPLTAPSFLASPGQSPRRCQESRPSPRPERGHSGRSQGPLEDSLPTALPAPAAQEQEWGWAPGRDRAPLAARAVPRALLTSDGSLVLTCSTVQDG